MSEKLNDVTVLITAAGNVFMPGTTKCLRENGERNLKLIGADMNDDPTMLQMVDKYYSVPRGDDPKYIEVLLDICARENVDVLLPIMSVELESLAMNKERFASIGTKVSVSNIDSLRVANDKLALFDFLRSSGLPCAQYASVTSLNELSKQVCALGYPNNPVCVKAIHGSGSRGFRILEKSRSKFDLFMFAKPSSCYTTLDDFIKIFTETDTFPELMVMEYLPGAEYTVDLLADNGKVLYNCCRKSLLMENSIMLNGEVVNNKQVMDLCATVVEMLGLDGNIGFDVKERSDGTPMIMECNPRITAGIPVFYLAGVNLPYLCVKKLLGESLPEENLQYGKVVNRRWLEMC